MTSLECAVCAGACTGLGASCGWLCTVPITIPACLACFYPCVDCLAIGCLPPHSECEGGCLQSIGDVIGCFKDKIPDNDSHDQPAQGAIDPNEKAVIAEKYIQPNQLLVYPIHFENIGTIEARDVFVTDVLDSNLDISTLKILTPNGSSFEAATRTVKWELLDINLLPDSTGNVLFSIRPLPDLPSGTEIRNTADIQFEVFDIYTTNEVVNIIDAIPPVGTMDSLPAEIDSLEFPISWSGTDPVGEVESYSILASVDGGEFTVFLDRTRDTSTVFSGEDGRTYGFICIAIDAAGNVEIQDPVAEAIVTVREGPGFGSISGFVIADSSEGLFGVDLDVYDSVGALFAVTTTDDSGYYNVDSLPNGDYSVAIVTPIGYQAAEEIKQFTIDDAPATVNFDLTKLSIPSQQRSMGYWKHQVNVYLSGKGNAQESLAEMSDYMSLVGQHFNNHPTNPITIFEVPQPADQTDSLEALQGLLTVKGNAGMNAKAKQQLIALMLNVVSLKLDQATAISDDSATVSQAITYCHQLITDSDSTNDETAKDIADQINNGILLASEMIPLTIPDIIYRGTEDQIAQTSTLPAEFSLEQNYPNPFNPICEIAYTLPTDCQVKLTIYNILGQKVRVLVDEQQTAGRRSVKWDSKDEQGQEVTSGIYIYRLQAGDFAQSKRMVLLK